MFYLQSKNGDVTVYAQTVEPEAISQILNMANSPIGENAHIRIMPDCHAGAGCTIDTTMRLTDKVCPNIVGVDIGCGMYVCRITITREIEKNFDAFLEGLDRTINEQIPSGKNVNDEIHDEAEMFSDKLNELYCRDHINTEYALQSLGSLGGGNHFIELNVNVFNEKIKEYYLVVHSGSRHLGKEIAEYYQKKAINAHTKQDKTALIAAYKAAGREKEIQTAINAQKSIPFQKELAYCENELFDEYIHDMKIAQDFATLNRQLIVKEIRDRWCGKEELRPQFTEQFTTVHNYIDTENMILRKGAVSAQKNELLIIPMNMRDGSLLCRGKGNPEWNFSAPHGAGRLMSRSKAKEHIPLNDFKDSMVGIYTSSVDASTLDEAPMAYKPMQEILDCIEDTVTVLGILKPIYNFKAHDAGKGTV